MKPTGDISLEPDPLIDELICGFASSYSATLLSVVEPHVGGAGILDVVRLSLGGVEVLRSAPGATVVGAVIARLIGDVPRIAVGSCCRCTGAAEIPGRVVREPGRPVNLVQLSVNVVD